MKPASMTMFDYLYLGSLIVSLFGMIASWDYLVAEVHGSMAAEGLGRNLQQATSDSMPIFLAINYAFSLLLWALISVWRIGLARWIYALMTLMLVIGWINDPFSDPVWMLTVTGIISAIMNVGAVAAVFALDSGAWLRREI